MEPLSVEPLSVEPLSVGCVDNKGGGGPKIESLSENKSESSFSEKMGLFLEIFESFLEIGFMVFFIISKTYSKVTKRKNFFSIGIETLLSLSFLDDSSFDESWLTLSSAVGFGFPIAITGLVK